MHVLVLTFGSIKTDWRVIKSAYMLDKLGHDVTLATFSDEDEPHECRINDQIACVHLKFAEVVSRGNKFDIRGNKFKRRSFFHLHKASRFLKERLCGEDQPDLIYLHELDTLFCAVFLKFRYKDFREKKFIYDAHELERARWPLKLWFVRNTIRVLEFLSVKFLGASVVTVGRELANYLEQSWPRYSSVRVIGNKPSEAPLNDYLRRVGDSTNRIPKFSNRLPTGVMSGNVTFNRGIEQVFEAMSYVSKFNLVLVGNVHDYQRSYFQRFIEAFGITDNVQFVGPQPYHQVSNYLSNFDFGVIGVVPKTKSYELSCPNKLYELHNTNLPAIVTDLPETRSWKKNMNLPEWFLCDMLDPSMISFGVQKINELIRSKQTTTQQIRRPMYFNSNEDLETYKCLIRN